MAERLPPLSPPLPLYLRLQYYSGSNPWLALQRLGQKVSIDVQGLLEVSTNTHQRCACVAGAMSSGPNPAARPPLPVPFSSLHRLPFPLPSLGLGKWFSEQSSTRG